ncbi:hypothetical protein D1007_24819 [Hordeum vulgare]|nr:hypothetical protein D1007_24819 [Hordeum vulgare]
MMLWTSTWQRRRKSSSSPQADEMAEEQAIVDSIRDEAEVEANRRLIWQRHAKVDALFDEFEAEIAAEEATPKQSEGRRGP